MPVEPPFLQAPGAGHVHGFITPPMSVLLDLLRAACALVVVLGHAWQAGLLAGPAQVTPLAAHYAVVVFFVISGLAIGASSAKPGMTSRTYALDRATRIMPVAAAAVVLGSVLFLWRHGKGNVEWDLPALALTPEAILHPLLFLTEQSYGVLPVWNPAYWSLSYEVWYYVLFGAAVFLHSWHRLAVLALCAILAGLPVLLLLPIWLMGVALARWPRVRRIGWTGGAALAALAAALIAVLPLIDGPSLAWLERNSPIALYNSQNLVGDTWLGVALALGLAGVRPLLGPVGGWLAQAARPARWAAGMSFSVYLFHMPLLFTFQSFGLRDIDGPLTGAAAIAGLLGFCALLAELVERRTGTWRRLLDRPVLRGRESPDLRPLAADASR